MIKLLLKYKKGVSPIVTTLFIMAIIIAAISVSLGMIYPSLEELNESIELDANGSSLLSLDQELKTLMLSGGEAKIFKKIDTIGSGLIIGDDQSIKAINLIQEDLGGDQSNLCSPIYLIQSRLLIRQVSDQNIIGKDTTIYLTGSGFQELYFLNSSTKSILPWSMITEVRFSDQNIYTILTYRNLISIEREIDLPTINVTINIQSVEFTFLNGKTEAAGNPTLGIEYKGLNITSTSQFATLSYLNYQNFWLKTQTTLSPGSTSVIEQPYTHEVPENGFLNVKIQFITHMFDISM